MTPTPLTHQWQVCARDYMHKTIVDKQGLTDEGKDALIRRMKGHVNCTEIFVDFGSFGRTLELKRIQGEWKEQPARQKPPAKKASKG